LIVPKALKNGADTILVARRGGRSPTVVTDVQLVPQGDKLLRDLIHEFLRGDPLLLRRLLHFLSVLIDPRKEKDLVPFQSVVTGQDVGQHLFVSVPDVRRAVRVIDRSGDEERQSFWFEV
jgi:hypothetical protein